MENTTINYLAVLAAAVSDLAVGALWYSPILFGKAWMKANGFTEESLKGGNPAVTFGVTFLLALVISYILALFLGSAESSAGWGFAAGLLAGIAAAAALAIIALFERRTAGYILVNTGYVLTAFAVKGLIIGAWR
jgi:hypothetical protein